MLSAETIVELDKAFFYDEQVIWVDRTTRIEEIFNQINEELGNIVAASMSASSTDNKLLFQYRGECHSIPLTRMPHDRFIVINSIAELTKGDFCFWLAKDYIGEDRQGIFITDKATTAELENYYPDWVEKTLVKMELGYDYFSRERVPYLNHLTNLSKIFNRKKLMDRLAEERAKQALEKAKPKRRLKSKKGKAGKPAANVVAKVQKQNEPQVKNNDPLSESGLHASPQQNDQSNYLPLWGMLISGTLLLGYVSAL